MLDAVIYPLDVYLD